MRAFSTEVLRRHRSAIIPLPLPPPETKSKALSQSANRLPVNHLSKNGPTRLQLHLVPFLPRIRHRSLQCYISSRNLVLILPTESRLHRNHHLRRDSFRPGGHGNPHRLPSASEGIVAINNISPNTTADTTVTAITTHNTTPNTSPRDNSTEASGICTSISCEGRCLTPSAAQQRSPRISIPSPCMPPNTHHLSPKMPTSVQPSYSPSRVSVAELPKNGDKADDRESVDRLGRVETGACLPFFCCFVFVEVLFISSPFRRG